MNNIWKKLEEIPSIPEESIVFASDDRYILYHINMSPKDIMRNWRDLLVRVRKIIPHAYRWCYLCDSEPIHELDGSFKEHEVNMPDTNPIYDYLNHYYLEKEIPEMIRTVRMVNLSKEAEE